MYIYELILDARWGKKEAFNELVNRYFDDFYSLYDNEKDMNLLHKIVINKYNLKTNDDDILDMYTKFYLKNELKAIIDYYLYNYDDDKLISFIRKSKNKVFQAKKDFMTKKDEYIDNEKKYIDDYYNLIKDKKSIFSNEEKFLYCKTFVNYVFRRPKSFANITAEIKKDFERIQDDMSFSLRYIMIVGLNDKILDYISNEYKYVLNRFISDFDILISDKEFKNAVSEALDNIYKSNVNLENKIYDILKKKHVKKTNITNINQLKSDVLSSEEIEKVREENHYIVYDVLNKFIDSGKDVSENELLKVLEDKYNKYFNYMIDLDMDYNIKRYLKNRLTDFCNKRIISLNRKYDINNNVDKEEYMKLYINNYYIYVKKLQKILKRNDCFISFDKADEILKAFYSDAIKKYMSKQLKSDIEVYIKRALSDGALFIKQEYGNDYYIRTKDYFNEVSRNNNIDDETYDSFINGYLNYYKNQEDMNVFLFNQIKYFDKDEMEEIKRIKKSINGGN